MISRTHRAFIERIEALGGKDLGDPWQGVMKPRRILCAAGHERTPTPNNIQRGQGLCRVCAGMDSEAAFKSHLERVQALGGADLGGTWDGMNKPRRTRCAQGHLCFPYPSGVRNGGGLCRICAGLDPESALKAHLERVKALGGRDLGDPWEGVDRPRRTRCPQGHLCVPRPGCIQRGQSLCGVCANRDSKAAFAAHLDRVRALGGKDMGGPWKNRNAPRRTLCPQGHECFPRPKSIQEGNGLCRICQGKLWDVFYIVRDPDAGLIKFGITSGDTRPRLRVHARDGFTDVLRVFLNFAEAQALETLIKSALLDAREPAIRGREYFPQHVLALVLDVADNYPRCPSPNSTGVSQLN